MGRRGFGSIERLPSGRYRARYRDPRDRRRWINAPTTFQRKGEADAWISAQWTAVASGHWTPPEDAAAAEAARARAQARTVGIVAAEWLDVGAESGTKGKPWKPKTLEHYRRQVAAHLDPTPLAALPVCDVTEADVRAWRDALPPGRKGGRRNAEVMLSGVLAHAQRAGDIPTNPADRILGWGRDPHVKQGATTIATPAQIDTIREHMPDRYRAMIDLAAWCALRFGEVTELRRGDVHGDTLHIRRAAEHVTGRGFVVDAPKSAAGIRTVTMPATVAQRVSDHLAAHVLASPDALLFPSQKDPAHHLGNSTLWHLYAPAVAAAGLPTESTPRLKRFTFHDLRHTGLTYGAQVGATPAELMARGGHSDPKTAQIYQHATAERDRALAARLDALISDDATQPARRRTLRQLQGRRRGRPTRTPRR
ncbi:tyrosine-type recombinase/integrase [Actinomyces culturomici]|uniref:tyrosine-type recombinase/integrase n=1 Tax=Actinomyces culturomici TaxID=1926276 RepID=UPI000E1FE0B4|nr:site-specific integrase [Actinomyces culturomici]